MKRILLNKCFLRALGWLIIQQMIVAVSTILITQAAATVSIPSRFFMFIFLYLLSLSLPYFPIIFSSREIELSVFLALQKYIEDYFRTFYGKVSGWRDLESKGRIIPILVNEAENTIRSATSILYDWISVVLNVGLNILAVSYVLSFHFLLAYLAAAAFLLFTYLFTHTKISKSSAEAQSSNISRNDSLMSAWDNVLIGNRYNFGSFHRYFLDKFESSRVKNVGFIFFSQTVATLSSVVCMLPIFGVVLWYLRIHVHEPAKLTEAMVTLPRQIQILNNFLVIASYISHWPSIRARIQGIVAIFEHPMEKEFTSKFVKVNWPSIQLTSDGLSRPLKSFEELKTITHSFAPGRFLITGKNGSGKSSLLIMVKAHLMERTFFLPTNTNLAFREDLSSFSTGQRIIRLFEEVQNISDIDVLLLDEWDANLDRENAEEVSAIVNQLSKHLCVIETRHFRG